MFSITNYTKRFNGRTFPVFVRKEFQDVGHRKPGIILRNLPSTFDYKESFIQDDSVIYHNTLW